MRNVLSRALLAGIEHPADMWLLRMIAGDRVLVCSDGLTTEVDDGTIAAVLWATPDPQAAPNELAKMAVDAGGRDNVTAWWSTPLPACGIGGLFSGSATSSPLRVHPQNGINGTTTIRRTITAANTAVNARSMEMDPNRTGFSTRRTGPIAGSVMPWVIRRAW
jgi:hypothetical protein